MILHILLTDLNMLAILNLLTESLLQIFILLLQLLAILFPFLEKSSLLLELGFQDSLLTLEFGSQLVFLLIKQMLNKIDTIFRKLNPKIISIKLHSPDTHIIDFDIE